MKKTDQLLQYVQRFFQDYMRTHRGMSPNTILAYRDAIKLFLRFLTSYKGKQASMLSLDYLQADAVLAFLENTETRGSSVATRNLRLSALRTFFGYLITQDTFRVGQYQRVIAIPLKQAPQPLVGYLEKDEVKAILDSIDQTIPTGRRDYILISLLHKTGARVQEICDLRGEDIYLSPPSVIITGKGRKTRQVPICQESATALTEYMNGRDLRERIFQNARGLPLTRFGISHIIQTRTLKAATTCPSLAKKKVTPHTFRHTTAMHLLQSGVELNVIKSWLGHVQISTTHAYMEIDLKMKQKALGQCMPINNKSKLNDLIRQNEDVISWLDSL